MGGAYATAMSLCDYGIRRGGPQVPHDTLGTLTSGTEVK